MGGTKYPADESVGIVGGGLWPPAPGLEELRRVVPDMTLDLR